MKIQRIKNLQGASKYDACIECDKDCYNEENLVRLTFESRNYEKSICLCPECLNRLIGFLRDNY